MLVSKSSLTTFLVKSSINVCAHLYECVQLERKFLLRITSSLGPDQFAKRYPVSEEAYTIYLALQKHTLPLSWQIKENYRNPARALYFSIHCWLQNPAWPTETQLQLKTCTAHLYLILLFIQVHMSIILPHLFAMWKILWLVIRSDMSALNCQCEICQHIYPLMRQPWRRLCVKKELQRD